MKAINLHTMQRIILALEELSYLHAESLLALENFLLDEFVMVVEKMAVVAYSVREYLKIICKLYPQWQRPFTELINIYHRIKMDKST